MQPAHYIYKLCQGGGRPAASVPPMLNTAVLHLKFLLIWSIIRILHLMERFFIT